MHYLYYSIDEDGDFVFWKQGHGYGHLSEATVFDEATSKIIDHLGSGVGTGVWYGTEQPELAAIELTLAQVLRDNYDTNFHSQAGSEHVARQLASKLDANWMRIGSEEASRITKELWAICHDYQQAPFYETVFTAWAIMMAFEHTQGKGSFGIIKPIIEGFTDVSR